MCCSFVDYVLGIYVELEVWMKKICVLFGKEYCEFYLVGEYVCNLVVKVVVVVIEGAL